MVLLGIAIVLAIGYPLVYRSLENRRSVDPVARYRGPRDLRDLRDPRPRAQHRDGLRRSAGPRLRRVLRDRRVHDCVPGSGHFGIHISWWIVVWIAVAAAALFGIALGAPTLKLRGDYLAIVTLGFGEIVRLVFRNLGDFTLGAPGVPGRRDPHRPEANLTGGNVGINPIDPPTIPIPGPWGNSIIFSNRTSSRPGTWCWRCSR